jgi:hypothetical protein
MRSLSVWTVVMLAACAAPQPVVVENTCAGFIIGKSTRAEILNKCGQPFLHYESATTSKLSFIIPGGRPGVRHVEDFSFDAQGVLTSIEGT